MLSLVHDWLLFWAQYTLLSTLLLPVKLVCNSKFMQQNCFGFGKYLSYGKGIIRKVIRKIGFVFLGSLRNPGRFNWGVTLLVIVWESHYWVIKLSNRVLKSIQLTCLRFFFYSCFFFFSCKKQKARNVLQWYGNDPRHFHTNLRGHSICSCLPCLHFLLILLSSAGIIWDIGSKVQFMSCGAGINTDRSNCADRLLHNPPWTLMSGPWPDKCWDPETWHDCDRQVCVCVCVFEGRMDVNRGILQGCSDLSGDSSVSVQCVVWRR